MFQPQASVTPSLDAKVAFLREPSAYPEPTATVDVVETHMSWVFITATRAYKLKKPIRRDSLDYGTLAARRLNCRREVKLNRRLAPDVYLGLTALRAGPDGGLRLAGPGAVVDWLVTMRRLPEELTLRHAILRGGADDAAIDRLVGRLVAFFRSAPAAALAADAYCQRLERSIGAAQELLSRPAFTQPRQVVEAVADAMRAVLAARRDDIGRRAAQLVEGHGDLRPEHVYLSDPPVITDCIEFDRGLRVLDPADEIAFLSMECEQLGASATGQRIVASWRRATGDGCDAALMHFYACRNAFVRAKLAAWHLEEPGLRDPEKWRRSAQRYLALADRHARGPCARPLASARSA